MNKQSIHVLAITTTLLLASVSVAYAQLSVLHAFTGGADGKNPYLPPVVSGSKIYWREQPGGQRWRGGLFGRYGRHELQRSAYVYERFTGRLRTARLGCSERLDPLWNDLLRGQRQRHCLCCQRGWHRLSDCAQFRHRRQLQALWQRDRERLDPVRDDDYSGSGLGLDYSVGTNGNGYTLLHSFTGGTTDGSRPLGGSLMLSDSTLFGMTRTAVPD